MYAALDTLEESVGEAAHLEMLRAIGLNEEGKIEKARSVIKHALTLEPKMEKANWTQVEFALGQKDFSGVTTALKQIVERFGYTEFAMEGNEAYADYIKDAEYEKFQAYLSSLKK